MQYTLLQLVQTIGSSMDSDSITSINDSVESLQIATVVRTAYFDLINRINLPEHFSLFNLTQSSDTTKPILMFLPTTVAKVKWLKYDIRTVNQTAVNFQMLKYLPLEDFLNMTYTLNTDDATVDSITQTISGSSVQFLYSNNRPPEFYTSFDDFTYIFDSYDSSIDTVLTSTKTIAYGQLIIPWTMTDNFVPDLDDPQFELLLNEAKSLAWAELRQTSHQKAESSARRLWIKSQTSKYATDDSTYLSKLPNFGRR